MNTTVNHPSIPAIAAKSPLPDLPDPVTCFSRLTHHGTRPHTVLLESAEPSSRKTQRSLLVISSALSIVCRGASVEITALDDEGRTLLPHLVSLFSRYLIQTEADQIRLILPLPKTAQGLSEQNRLRHDSTLTVLRELAAAFTSSLPHFPEAVFLTGVFAYDFVDQFETLAAPQAGNDFPDYQFYLADQMIVIDHVQNEAYAIACSFHPDHADSLERRLQYLQSVALETIQPERTIFRQIADFPEAQTDCNDVAFAANVEALKKYIISGDVFQIVFSRIFSLPCRDAFAAYRVLRSLNPSPYLFYMNGGDFVLFGASPESAVKVDETRHTVEISPIAGTCRRGLRNDGSIDFDLDSRLEAELRLDEKENAEHMMLVDLARNDIARVCKPATRSVTELLRTERYSHVMHLVSRVSGVLCDDLDALHAYQASMNMGTLTGAPKIRAMQLLREIEGKRRGHYGGTIGYLRGDGSFDTAIVIRAALTRNGLAEVRAGAGIVYDSDPLHEADETRRKAEAVLRAIAIAENMETVHG
ncbi:MAG: anthranilate synthase component 1 [Burkholderiales bacterium]|jgi:anthranilate synthase component 1|nr:anthranilate synthase component 1 [Burkholderiales bacterium]